MNREQAPSSPAIQVDRTDRDPAASSGGGKRGGIGLLGLIALVVSSSIGSGVFALSTDISAAAAPGPALIAWGITGIGFMALATTFGRLSLAKPELNGIVAYAKEGFGPFIGFVSGWGYWVSIWVGNIAFGVMLVTSLGYFFPVFSGDLTVIGIAFISAFNWIIVYLINRGVEEASALNAVVMICKLVPIALFILTMVVCFRPEVFTADFWGTLANNLAVAGAGDNAPGSVPTQIINCFMVMMWVFVGMEGASVLGHRARRKNDVSKATVLGTTLLLVVYIAASILPYGFMSRDELMTLGSPSMPYIFQAAVGPWGGAFISAGACISIFGAWLSYTILASEAMHEMAQMELLPSIFGKLNGHGAPTLCLIATGAMIQIVSIVMLFSEAAYQFAYSLCTAAVVIAWALASAYMVKLAWPRRDEKTARISLALAAFSTAFLVAAICLAGIQLLALCCITYIPGIACYWIGRREYAGTGRIFTRTEAVCAVALVVVAAVAIALLACGIITI